MKQMTSTFADEVRKKEHEEGEKEVFDIIYNSLEKVYGKDKVDLEAIMSVILGLKEKERVKDNIGDFGLFMLERKGVTNPSDGSEFTTPLILGKLENEFKQLVRNKVVILEPRKIDLLRSVYTDFFKQLCAVTNCSGGEDSNPYKYSASKWSFFTTNYDNALEDFWVNHRKYPLDVGFTNKNGKKVMDAERFVHYNNSNTYSAMQLVKLHGSVNWIRNRDEDIEEVGYHLNYDEVKARTGSTDIQEDMMIYPVSQKQLYFTPFLQFFRILDAELKRRNFWIVIGYSFRDVIVRTMFERGLGENNKRKILLVHPHASEQIKPLFQASVSDQVICLDSYFATRNYGYVNKDIADALSNMANPYRT